MNQVELSVLRDRVARAQLAHEPAPKLSPKQAAGVAALRAMKLAGRCVYCGAKATSKKLPRTCRLHHDLPALDPNYEGGTA